MKQHQSSIRQRGTSTKRHLAASAAVGALLVAGITPNSARADEGGVSFWLPGLFGSLASVPVGPGWAFSSFLYNTNVHAGADVATAREITIGRFNPTVNLNLNASLNNDTAIMWLNPSYAFATPVLGGQLAMGVGGFVGYTTTSVNGTLTASIPPFGLVRSDSISQSVTGVGDLYPLVSLKWHQGNDNFMVYGTGDIPVGTYNSSSLANLGIGHGAVDAGAGYTYLNQTTGNEFSITGGFTYNLTNTSTNYQNGVDFHVDWGTSKYLSKQFFIGAVGYVYDQLSADSGSGDLVGPFESRVIGVGPQMGYLFPLGTMQGYLNLKAYGEFDARDRASGYNVWLTFAITPPEPAPMTKSPMSMYHK